jgi:hypothetical protein
VRETLIDDPLVQKDAVRQHRGSSGHLLDSQVRSGLQHGGRHRVVVDQVSARVTDFNSLTDLSSSDLP